MLKYFILISSLFFSFQSFAQLGGGCGGFGGGSFATSHAMNTMHTVHTFNTIHILNTMNDGSGNQVPSLELTEPISEDRTEISIKDFACALTRMLRVIKPASDTTTEDEVSFTEDDLAIILESAVKKELISGNYEGDEHLGEIDVVLRRETNFDKMLDYFEAYNINVELELDDDQLKLFKDAFAIFAVLRRFERNSQTNKPWQRKLYKIYQKRAEDVFAKIHVFISSGEDSNLNKLYVAENFFMALLAPNNFDGKDTARAVMKAMMSPEALQRYEKLAAEQTEDALEAARVSGSVVGGLAGAATWFGLAYHDIYLRLYEQLGYCFCENTGFHTLVTLGGTVGIKAVIGYFLGSHIGSLAKSTYQEFLENLDNKTLQEALRKVRVNRQKRFEIRNQCHIMLN